MYLISSFVAQVCFEGQIKSLCQIVLFALDNDLFKKGELN